MCIILMYHKYHVCRVSYSCIIRTLYTILYIILYIIPYTSYIIPYNMYHTYVSSIPLYPL